MNAVTILFRGDAIGALAAAKETEGAIEGVSKTSEATSTRMGGLGSATSSARSRFGELAKTALLTSGAFLGAAGLVEGLKTSGEEAEKLEKAQRSLDAAIEHTGGNVKEQRAEYDANAKSAAQYGVSQADATQMLARSLLLTGDSTKAQHAYNEALVISKATGKDLNSVLTATAKGQEGVTTSLQRYGINLKTGTSGQEQFRMVMARWGDQAKANTSQMDQLRANAANLEAELGGPLMRAVNYLAGALSSLILWL